MEQKEYFNLMQFFEGYVRNYRRFNLSTVHNRSMVTQREISHFADLGEMLGFDSFIEDTKFDAARGRSRPMDLAWWKLNIDESEKDYAFLALHLERENIRSKDLETIDKLFSETDAYYVPQNVIGIQHVESAERMAFLNEEVASRAVVQGSAALMVYWHYDREANQTHVYGEFFGPYGERDSKHAVCTADPFGYWAMNLVKAQPVG
jgi:hypothetical protein